MSNKKPEPLISGSICNRCPVCGEASYSASGIHPQCAVRQQDAIRLGLVKSTKRTNNVANHSQDSLRWRKICPNCNASVHVRKKTCDCGYQFTGKSNSG